MPKKLDIALLGNPAIRQTCEAVDDVQALSIQSLIDDMFHTMEQAGGVGIAAPQVHADKRIIILGSRPNARYPYAPNMEPTAMINPELLWASEEKEKGWEGCLTVPGIRGLVPRSTHIKVRYLTRDGESIETEYEGFIARVFQHEVDHLDGHVFIDRVESTLDLMAEAEWLETVMPQQKA